MNLFQILSNPIFQGTHVELYSQWIKKRILVYEYGQGLWGKVKLSMEPEEEEGALVYFPNPQDNALAQALDGLFFYRHKNDKQYTAVGVISQPEITEDQINTLFHTLAGCEALPTSLVRWKLIILTRSYPEQAIDWLRTIVPDILLENYDNPPGRDVEVFIKKLK